MRRGFTLIELLVIVAIIGIFATVALVSTSGARDRGKDAAIKSNLNVIKNQAEIYYYSTGKYSYTTGGCGFATITCNVYLTGCPTNPSVFQDETVRKALTAAKTASYNNQNNVKCANDTAGTSYAVAVKSKADPTKWFCIDNKGANRLITAAAYADLVLGGGGVVAGCPAS